MTSGRWSVVSGQWGAGRQRVANSGRSLPSIQRMLVGVLASFVIVGIAGAQTDRGPLPPPVPHSLNSQPSPLNSSAIDRQLGVQNQIRWQRGLPPTLPDYSPPLEPSPWALDPLIPPPYFAPARQPTGHRITETGPNSYTYEPTYDVDLPAAAVPPQIGPPALSADVQQPPPPVLSPISDRELLATAVEAFRAGRYEESLRQLARLELVRPRHGPAGLLRTQALLALGDYRAAADSLRRALGLIPTDQWGLIVENFGDYYPDPQQFADHLQRLGEHASRRPDDADARLLLGYEYGFLGHRDLAATELAQAARLAPGDALIERLIDRFGDVLPPEPTPIPPPSGRRAY